MKWRIGDRVASKSGGLVYIIKEIIELDMVGTTGYRVRRLKDGAEYGPARVIGSCGLCNLLSGDPEHRSASDVAT